VVQQLNAQHVWMHWLRRAFAPGGEIDEGKQLLLRIASMLTKLIERFDVSSSSSSSLIQEEPDEEGF
jgi:hypothetical protein